MVTPTTKRFQSWELDGRGRPRGVWPIAEGLEPDVFTEIDFDPQGRPLEAREHREGTPTPLVRKLELGPGGRLERQEYIDPLSSLSGQNLYEYDARGCMSARQELDAKGKLRYRIEVACDAEGRFSDERILDNRGRGVTRHKYQYGSNGLVVRDETYGGRALDQLTGFHRIEHDERGRIVRRSWHAPDGAEIEAFTYRYDEHDRRIEMAIVKAGKKTLSCLTEFDARGKKTPERYVDGEGDTAGRGENEDTPDAPPTAAEIHEAMTSLEKELQEVARTDPRRLQALAHVAYGQIEAGQHEEARKIFESLSVLEPANAYHHSALGAIALAEGRANTALDSFERALMRDERHLSSIVGRADALLRLNRIDDAFATLKKALALAPSHPNDPALTRARALVAGLTRASNPPPAPAPPR